MPGGIKDKLIELAEGVIAELNLNDDMDTFYEVQEFIMDNWDFEVTVSELVKEYVKKHPELKK